MYVYIVFINLTNLEIEGLILRFFKVLIEIIILLFTKIL